MSSTHFQNDRGKTAMIGKVRSMCGGNNYEVKRSKHRIESSGQPMRINNLQINNGVTLPKKERYRIRAAVHSCVKHFEEERTANEYHVLFNSTVGRVNHLRQFHRHEGKLLLKRLDACAPL